LSSRWQFWIDVGGTFTDCLAVDPSGRIRTSKLLSSGRLRARGFRTESANRIRIADFTDAPDDFFAGWTLSLQPGSFQAAVRRFDPTSGIVELDCELATNVDANDVEFYCGEEAPVVAIRRFLGLKLHEPIGAVDVRLGTTRGTNALLERQGTRTAFVTTQGFGDVLRIAHQNRPRLFDLAVRKPADLFEVSIEIDERLAADGSVLKSLDSEEVRSKLTALRNDGIASLAVCLLHAYRNPTHEERVAAIAEPLGFSHVALSSRLAPLQRIVPRGQTTVVDAYLTPIVREYLKSLRRSMPEADLRLMTSSGSLVDAERFVGKDSVLSGPAGGVVGASHVANEAGFRKAIGFDMGGTSTDVCRSDGSVERRYEMDVVDPATGGAVKIVAPMLAIETVAAGGGSICDFDGVKITVGPKSGGSIPGPACYGRGGPLCITDVNLFLGRIVSDRFPFPLDRETVIARLDEVRLRIKQSTGSEPGRERLAEGFLAVANANMAAAIKRVSVAKGYDVREYALISFGGAGAQHACAVADELGIRRVLQHPYASLLSAFGIGIADVTRFAVLDVGRTLDDESLADLDPVFVSMNDSLRSEILAEGLDPSQLLEPIRRLDLRYVGQDAVVTVTSTDGRDWAKAFESEHRKLYGFTFPGRAIEIRAARMELTGRTPKPKTPCLPTSISKPKIDGEVDAYFEGGFRGTPFYLREKLQSGDVIAGPALILEPNSSIVVAPHWTGTVSSRDDLVLERTRAPNSHAVTGGEIRSDPIELELFNNRFTSIAEQMGETLRRTSLSTNVKERLDFSCAIFSADGSLVVNAPHIPVHLGAMGDCVRGLLEDVSDMKPGDVYITNDPYRGGSHLPDVTVVTPVFDFDGLRLLFFTGSRAHHAEIGGNRPGSMPPFSASLAEEGILIRAFRFARDGVNQEADLHRLLTSGPYPSRSPGDNLADIRAQVAANKIGADLLQTLVGSLGEQRVLAFMEFVREGAAAKVRQSLLKLPAGVHRFEDSLDDSSKISVAVTIKHGDSGGAAIVDFNGTGPTSAGNLNANPAIVRSAVLYCFRCLLAEDVPLNDGVLAPVKIVVPPGTLLSPSARVEPENCPAVVGGNVETSQRIVDVVFGAIGAAAASQGTMNNFLFGRAATKERPAFGYYETICGGGGAGPGFNGADAVHTHMTNTRITDPEVLEDRYPVRLREFSIRRGSGGNGQWKGGDGVVREFEFLEPLEVSLLTNRRVSAPFGLAGGEHGASGRNLLRRRGESAWTELSSAATVEVQQGDVLRIETPGGGGFGKVQVARREARE
jgi:5-oxoprolinase (ATP-hydrolysing)